MSKHTEGQYVVCGGSDQYWVGTNAKTLNGAKVAARRVYHCAVGGKIEVARCRASEGRYEVVAIKYGHDAWQTA